MTATYTFDVFSSLDGYGSMTEEGDWGGYWGKQGPDLLAHRRAQFEREQRLVFGANTYRQMASFLSMGDELPEFQDPWVQRMTHMPLTVVSSTLTDPLEWPGGARIEAGDGVDVVRRLKETSDIPLRSHGSLRLNWALLNAGLVDRLQVTIFPALTGRTGEAPVLAGAGDFDLELVETHTLDERTQELVYRPSIH